jgi:flagella basal body P-ring formation protein FlgA
MEFPPASAPSAKLPDAPARTAAPVAAATGRRPTGAAWRIAVIALLLTGHPADSSAEPAGEAPSGLAAALEAQVRQLALGGGPSALAGVTRVEVAVGQLDPRLRLAPCARVEPYVPSGTRLWGRSRIGLRCVEGPSAWKVFLPITIKAWGRGLVANGAIAPGSVLRPNDVSEGEVDLAEDRSAAVADPSQAIGRTLARALAPGQSLRLADLKVRQWFNAGDTVRLIAVGAGFSLESEGQALSNGIEGQPARVRTENGRIVIGRPVGSRRLELAL